MDEAPRLKPYCPKKPDMIERFVTLIGEAVEYFVFAYIIVPIRKNKRRKKAVKAILDCFDEGFDMRHDIGYDDNEYSIDRNLKTIEKLSSTWWEHHDVDEKLDVLQRIADMECYHLGIPVNYSVHIEPLDGREGYIELIGRLIVIDTKVINFPFSREALEVLCHEIYHAYQYWVKALYEHTHEALTDLALFQAVQEINRCETILKGNGSIYNRVAERDADIYAYKRASYYSERYLQL